MSDAVPVLLNLGAGLGGSEAAGARITEALESAGVRAEIRALKPDDLLAALREAAESGAPTVGIAGGDGTLLAAAELLAGGSTALAPFPTGTLNHFSRRLGVADIEGAARALAAGHEGRVPVGLMDDRIFLNTATFGIYADVVRRRERWRPALRKWGAAAVSFLAAFVRMREVEVGIEVEGRYLHRRTPLVWVGVGWGSFPFVHEAPERRSSPDLEIVVVRPRGRLGTLALLLRLGVHLSGRNGPVEDPALEILHARHLLIRAHGKIGVTLDGEVLRTRGPIFVAVQDEALPVIVPPAGDA
jgi:diacylglycerol kinase family enzyme